MLNPYGAEFIFRKGKILFIFSIIAYYWNDAGSWGPLR